MNILLWVLQVLAALLYGSSGVHVKYREVTPIIMSGVLGFLMAFVAYGRMILAPVV